MSELDALIGRNIRILRRARRMTLEQMAEKLHKSKATAGKYEQGAIAMDVDTLFDAAAALCVRPSQLLSDIVPGQAGALKGAAADGTRKYLYYYDGRTGRTVRSLLVTDTAQQGEPAVTLFYNIASFTEPSRCRALYYGKKQKHDFVTNYLMENQSNGIEHMFICVTKPLDYAGQETGMLSGLSSRTMLPVSAKCVLSETALNEDDALVARLLLTKEDMRLTRKCNMFALEQMDY